MSSTIPFRRSAPATHTRLSKAQLLPIARGVADELALHAHLALETLRVGSPDIAPAQHIAEVMLLAKFLADAGHGNFPDEALVDADQTIARMFDGGRESGSWSIEAEAVERLAAIVSLYDHQLRRATLGALTTASDRLERFKAGEPYQGSRKKRA
ncbi:MULTISPECIES: hypothetical protein [unclassified Caballeronia]|uniref:hypothetical protein n=1 Tax=unclassified Caballeronia TaxID=2646786 RepID=UPI00158C4393|nr:MULTISPECIES: hypothetical protein [unclassified Caballeronia]QSN63989.1 hypothetical protein JYK05_21980 [Caballeronia sp. M1242]